MAKRTEISFLASKKSDPSSTYPCSYESTVMPGEFVRNMCVNLGIDPDTHDGVTRNVIVWRRCPTDDSPSWKQWDYHPTASLVKSGMSNGVELMFEEVKEACGGGGGSGADYQEEVAYDIDVPIPGAKRRGDDMSPFANDETAAIASAIDCSSMLLDDGEAGTDDAEVVVAHSLPVMQREGAEAKF